MKLWGGRFRKGENKLMEEFNKSFGIYAGTGWAFN